VLAKFPIPDPREINQQAWPAMQRCKEPLLLPVHKRGDESEIVLDGGYNSRRRSVNSLV
jgi:hypothetical protein